MPADEETNSDENPPGPKRPPRGNSDREVALKPSNRAGVLTPLLKSLGWELVGVGAQFEIDSPEPGKPTGRRIGRRATTQSLVDSSPAASVLYS